MGHILVVLLLIVVLFGAGRVPQIAENFAKGIKAFKKGLKDEEEQNPRISESQKKDDNT
jgi:sec-independent protein translocase protein TatA